jgi:hypothetical protein
MFLQDLFHVVLDFAGQLVVGLHFGLLAAFVVLHHGLHLPLVDRDQTSQRILNRMKITLRFYS